MVYKGLTRIPVFAETPSEFSRWLRESGKSRKQYRLCLRPYHLNELIFQEIVVLEGARRRANWHVLVRRILSINPMVKVITPQSDAALADARDRLAARECSRFDRGEERMAG